MPQKNHKDNHAPTCSAELSQQTAILAEEAVAGNEAAFNRLVDLFQEDIFRMVYYRTLSRMDAEDITQDVFVKAFKNISTLKSPDRFKSWLFSIALNRVRDFYRKKHFLATLGFSGKSDDPERNCPEEKEDPDPLKNLMRRDFWRHVGLFLDKLPHMEREVFTLRFMDYLSIREISEVMKKRESTVKTHLYRALGKFRKEPGLRQILTKRETS